MGYRLRRSVNADRTSFVVVLWFGDDLSVENLSTRQAEGARVYDSGGDVACVIWPSDGSVSGFSGFDMTGRMGGRRFDRPAYFGGRRRGGIPLFFTVKYARMVYPGATHER